MPEQETAAHDAEANIGQPLTNEDFRKLMMTPRVASGSSSSSVVQTPVAASRPERSREERKVRIEHEQTTSVAGDDLDDAATRRRKKKSFYAKLKKKEEEREKELSDRYRDRARERRDGMNKDYQEAEVISTTADYRTVAPTMKPNDTNVERRKQVIQESKYLGGDMEHTHLVKGLDFALLEKVRAEINSKEREVEIEIEMERAVETAKQEKEVEVEDVIEEKLSFRTHLGRNIYQALFKPKVTERNEHFLPRRMAYIIELEDDYGASDIPTTLLRSQADCPTVESTTVLSNNDIVINKLTQIISYLRQGRRDSKKLKKKEKDKKESSNAMKEPTVEDTIYGDIGDYVPSLQKDKSRVQNDGRRERRHDRNKDHERERNRGGDSHVDYDRNHRDAKDRREDRKEDKREDRRLRGEKKEEKKKSYFEKPAEDMMETDKDLQESANELIKTINSNYSSKQWQAEQDLEKAKEEERTKKLNKKISAKQLFSYAECYPGMAEMADAIDDSDEEADYTKMDQGNKKGPVGRWDFDTPEEYSNYMSGREALPKAAFQYGVKMSDGRKTRRAGGKDDKGYIDREWQKIQNIIQTKSSSNHVHQDDRNQPYKKKPRY